MSSERCLACRVAPGLRIFSVSSLSLRGSRRSKAVPESSAGVPVSYSCHVTRNGPLIRAKFLVSGLQFVRSFVEVAGFEPASSGAAIGLLRAQPASDCRGRHFCRRQYRPVTNEVSSVVSWCEPLSKPY